MLCRNGFVNGWFRTFSVLIPLVLFPFIISNPYYLHLAELSLVYLLAVFGLNLLLGFTGQASAGHGALVAIGAYSSALITTKYGLPIGVGFLVGICATMVAGFLLGLPALKLGGSYLVMVTMSFNIILEKTIVNWPSLTQGPMGIYGIPPLQFGQFPLDGPYLYLILLMLVVVTFWVIKNLIKNGFGLTSMGIRDNELCTWFLGINVHKHKVIVFAFSAVLAGIAGGMYAHLTGYVSPDVFSVNMSLLLLLMVIIGGMGTLWGPVYGALFLTAMPEILRPLANYHLIIYGIMLVVALAVAPRGIAGALGNLRPTKSGNAIAGEVDDGGDIPLQRQGHAIQQNVLLSTEAMGINFGGIRALDHVSFNIEAGTIHSLIGPNGSGKSTTINIISGLYKGEGRVLFRGEPIQCLAKHKIALRGIARTFQNGQLCTNLNAVENVALAVKPAQETGLASMCLSLQAARKAINERLSLARKLLVFVGFNGDAQKLVKALPYGEQRLVEIARALALNPSLLLLDEPASGLSIEEKSHLRKVLIKIKNAGITILLVEHNMDLVMDISDKLTVLNFGSVIAEGAPQEIVANPEVIEVYLGKGEGKRVTG